MIRGGTYGPQQIEFILSYFENCRPSTKDYLGAIVGRTKRSKSETAAQARARVAKLVGEGWRADLVLDKRDQKFWVWRERS